MLLRQLFERNIPPEDQVSAPEEWINLTDEAKRYFSDIGHHDWNDSIDIDDAKNALEQGNMEQAGDDTMSSIVSLYIYLEKNKLLNKF